AATMTQRAIAPLTLDMQRVLASPYARHLHLDATIAGSGALPAGSEAEVTLRVVNDGLASFNEVVVNSLPTTPLESVPGTPPTVRQLEAAIRRVPGVTGADGLGFVDMPPRSLTSLATGVRIDRALRVFAFDEQFARHYPSIHIAAGSFSPDGALLSVEASRALGARPGASVGLRLPGDAGVM